MNEPVRVGRPAEVPGESRMFLTAEEVGQRLGLKRSRVYELAAAGRLPVVRLGRRMLFPRRGLDELVEAAIDRVRAEPFEADQRPDWVPGQAAHGRVGRGRGAA